MSELLIERSVRLCIRYAFGGPLQDFDPHRAVDLDVYVHVYSVVMPFPIVTKRAFLDE